MRRWGIAITSLYALIVLGLLLPGFFLLAIGKWSDIANPTESKLWSDIASLYAEWLTWIVVAIAVGAQALLLFLSVDTSRKRLKPRQHILVSIATAAFLFAILTFAAIFSLYVVFWSKTPELIKPLFNLGSATTTFAWLAVLWLFWAILFYLYLRESRRLITRLVSWLLAGSVLELLIAVPCHVIVRHRDECTAPAVTSFGIVTGIAIMFLSFGPSVLFLYKKRLDGYKRGASTSDG